MPSPQRSTVFDWNHLAPIPTPKGARRDLCDVATATLDRFECHVTTLNAGAVPHEAHQHPDEELIIVKEGTMEVTINGQCHPASAGSVIFLASNDLHGLRNPGPGTATYYVQRWTSPGREGPQPPQA